MTIEILKTYLKIVLNKQSLNFIAGRSWVCVDRMGTLEKILFMYLIGGPARFYSIQGKKIVDEAPKLNINKITGGRAIAKVIFYQIE